MDTLKRHIRCLPNGSQVLIVNHRLSQSFKRILKTSNPHGPLISSFVDQVDTMASLRAVEELALCKAVTETSKQSEATRMAPTEENQRKLTLKRAHMEDQYQNFYQFISGLSEQFALIEANERAKWNNALILRSWDIPLVNLDGSEIALLPKTDDEQQTRPGGGTPQNQTGGEHGSTPAAAAVDSLNSAVSHPSYVQYVLREIGHLLSPFNSHLLEGEFGVGGQGVVFKAKLKAEGSSIVALKVAQITATNHQARVNEVRFTSRRMFLEHPNILSAEWASIFQVPEPEGSAFHLAIAFMPMLDGCLDDYTGNSWPEKYIACLMRQLLSALQRIHFLCFIHNDIKPANIFIDGEVVKIGDFGQAEYIVDFKKTKVGTVRRSAPEAAKAKISNNIPKAKPTDAVDIWGLGCTLYELLVGKLPFDEISENEILLKAIVGKGLVLPKKGNYSAKVKDFFSQMTKTDPAERWTANQLFNHSFIAEACPPEKLAEFIQQIKEARS